MPTVRSIYEVPALLEDAGLGVDLEALVLDTPVGVVVMVHPGAEKDVTAGRMDDDRPVRLVDPDASHLVVDRAFDALEVDPRPGGILLKLLGELPNLFLNRNLQRQ